jgi:manganese transport protein
MAGQVIMQGFCIFISLPGYETGHHVPSLIVIFIGLDPTRTLVISQVVLSFGSIAYLLVMFTADVILWHSRQ